MYRIKTSFLLFLLLLPGQSRAMDGCMYGEAWSCGGVCIGLGTECKCGDSSFFAWEGKWCCTEDGKGCEGKGEIEEGWDFWRGEENKEGRRNEMGYLIKIGADCPAGQVRNLTQACHSLCNYFPEDPWRHKVGERSFFPSNVTEQGLKITQCIPEGEKLDRMYDCDNRADEDPFHSGNYDLNLDLPNLLVPCD